MEQPNQSQVQPQPASTKASQQPAQKISIGKEAKSPDAPNPKKQFFWVFLLAVIFTLVFVLASRIPGLISG